MDTTHKLLQVRQMDERALHWGRLRHDLPPRRGWINAIRKALSMSTSQLASRIGVTRQAVLDLERRETTGGATLMALEKAAEAMDCVLLYAVIPRESLKDTLWRRATFLAAKRLGRVAHSMKLEKQDVPREEYNSQVTDLAAQILQGSRRDLWSE